MGTSSARRGPTTRLWRRAKGAATRYLAPAEEGRVVEAREVVARYLVALKETAGPGEASGLAAFRLTRKVAQNLGAFLSQAASQGWSAALTAWGLADLEEQSPELLAQGLAGALCGPGGGLEEAVARAALITVLSAQLLKGGPAPGPETAGLVRDFLATALYLRLALDLGESLEAAGLSYGRLKNGLEGIRGMMEKAATVAVAQDSEAPEQWPGLPGSAWVTRVMETMVEGLKGENLSKGQGHGL